MNRYLNRHAQAKLGALISATRTAAAVLRTRGSLPDHELAAFLLRAAEGAALAIATEPENVKTRGTRDDD